MSRRDEQPRGERDTERFRAQVEAMRAQGAKWKDIYRAVHGSGTAIIASADRYAELDAAAAARLDRDYWTH